MDDQRYTCCFSFSSGKRKQTALYTTACQFIPVLLLIMAYELEQVQFILDGFVVQAVIAKRFRYARCCTATSTACTVAFINGLIQCLLIRPFKMREFLGCNQTFQCTYSTAIGHLLHEPEEEDSNPLANPSVFLTKQFKNLVSP